MALLVKPVVSIVDAQAAHDLLTGLGARLRRNTSNLRNDATGGNITRPRIRQYHASTNNMMTQMAEAVRTPKLTAYARAQFNNRDSYDPVTEFADVQLAVDALNTYIDGAYPRATDAEGRTGLIELNVDEEGNTQPLVYLPTSPLIVGLIPLLDALLARLQPVR